MTIGSVYALYSVEPQTKVVTISASYVAPSYTYTFKCPSWVADDGATVGVWLIGGTNDDDCWALATQDTSISDKYSYFKITISTDHTKALLVRFKDTYTFNSGNNWDVNNRWNRTDASVEYGLTTQEVIDTTSNWQAA